MYIIRNLFLCIFGITLIQCQNHTTINNIITNPYKDDYSKIATLAQRNKWNAANVHDPSCIKVNDTYYLYSTDAYFIPPNTIFKNDSSIKLGHIPYRSSKDLVHWKFEGWIFDSIPSEEYNFVKSENNGNPPSGIWSPFIFKAEKEYRLYYAVSYYGTNQSCVAMASSPSPTGPWKPKGIVVQTTHNDIMNAIDPTVIKDHKSNKEWLIYGSHYDGLYCLELNPHDGMTIIEGDKGHCIARRSEKATKDIGASEVFYNEQLDMYYLFLSYNPLLSNYDVRVGRSTTPNGPYFDFNGNDLKDTTNNYPILTSNYIFTNHPGWTGNSSCCILKDKNNYFMLHHSRLAPDNNMFQLHTRELKWLKSGWPVVSPERFVPLKQQQTLYSKDLVGNWEIIQLNDSKEDLKFSRNMKSAGEWKYNNSTFNQSGIYSFCDDFSVVLSDSTSKYIIEAYKYIDDNTIELIESNKVAFQCKIFNGWDWENQTPAILFSGINTKGISIWGKKING